MLAESCKLTPNLGFNFGTSSIGCSHLPSPIFLFCYQNTLSPSTPTSHPQISPPLHLFGSSPTSLSLSHHHSLSSFLLASSPLHSRRCHHSCRRVLQRRRFLLHLSAGSGTSALTFKTSNVGITMLSEFHTSKGVSVRHHPLRCKLTKHSPF